MNEKCVFLLVIIIMCFQHINAKTMPDNEESSESYEQYEFMGTADLAKLTPCGRLFAFTLGRYAPTLIRLTLKQGRELVEGVQNDTSILKQPTEELQVHLKVLDNFVERAKMLNYLKDKPVNLSVSEVYREAFKSVVDFANILEKYNTKVLDYPSMEETLVKISLEKYGAKEIQKEFFEKFAKFSEWFLKRTDQYLASLSAEERKTESKMIEWFRQFKMDPKVQVFDKFVDLFDMNVIFKDIEGWQ